MSNSILDQKLDKALREAMKRRGEVQYLHLSGGLDIALYVDAAGENHVQFRRMAPTWPADIEIDVVLRRWHQPGTPKLSELQARREKNDRTCAISVQWKPARPELGQTV